MIFIKSKSLLVNRILTRYLISLCVLVVLPSSVSASEEFWGLPLANANNADYGYGSDDQVSSSFTEYTNYDGSYVQQSSLAMTQTLRSGADVALRYSTALKQDDLVVGYTKNNISVSYMTGSGENYAELSGQYAGVDPYEFHGGWNSKFRYDGFAFDYNLQNLLQNLRFGGRRGLGKQFGHLQYGQATVIADNLEDRTAKYFEWSNDRVFTRVTRFSRGDETIGNGFDAGIAFGNKRVALQTMSMDNNRSMQRIRLQFDGAKTRQYWLDFSSHRNALYRDNDDVRVMFSFKTLLGSRSLVSYLNEGETSGSEAQTQRGKGNGWKRGVFIGLGVAAAATVSSSGSDSQDSDTRFRTQTEAAFDVLNGINPRSANENKEYGGWVFINPDGSYASTKPVKGEAASVQLPNRSLVIPTGSRSTATYHTHAAFDPRYDNENFSPQDLAGDRRINVDGYLATPGGQFKFHNVTNDTVVTLGSIAN